MAAGAAVAAYFGASGATAAVVAGAVNGAIIGAAVGAVSAAVTGGNVLEGMAKGALTGAVTGAVAGGVSHAFSNAGGATIPEGTDVSQVGTGTEAGSQTIATPSQAAPVEPIGVMQTPEGVTVTEPTAAAQTTTTATTAVPTDNQYLLGIEKMGKDAFYREAASGAVQAGVGAYAEKEAAKSEAEMDRAAIEAAKPVGILRRDYAAPTVESGYAAAKPQVVAPMIERPTAVQVGVERPTADIRNISVQKGVLPNA
jgi:hypothetical protein